MTRKHTTAQSSGMPPLHKMPFSFASSANGESVFLSKLSSLGREVHEMHEVDQRIKEKCNLYLEGKVDESRKDFS